MHVGYAGIVKACALSFCLLAFLDSSTLQLFFDLYHSIPPSFSPLVSQNHSL